MNNSGWGLGKSELLDNRSRKDKRGERTYSGRGRAFGPRCDELKTREINPEATAKGTRMFAI